MTVAELIAMLQQFQPDREVVFRDPDTDYWLDVIVREPRADAGELFGTTNNPVFITAEYQA